MNDLPILQIIRGDTTTLHFHRLDAGGRIIQEKANKLFFTVKKKFTDTNYILQKTIDDIYFDSFFEYHITIDPSDTDGKPYGNYVYDIEVIDEDERKRTISRGIIAFTQESTWVNNE